MSDIVRRILLVILGICMIWSFQFTEYYQRTKLLHQLKNDLQCTN